MKERVFYQYLGPNGGTNGQGLFITTYDVESVNIIAEAIDQAGAEIIYVGAASLKPFGYDQHLLAIDAPNAAYFWLPPDGGATAHEAVSGVAMTIAGGGGGLLSGNAGAARYAGQYEMLAATNSAKLTGQGTFLEVSENNAQNWVWEAWLFKNSNAAASVYIETNAALTTYLAILFNGAGVLTVQQSGVLKWTAPAGGSVGAWHHYMLVYNAGAGTIQQFIDGVSSGAATAYTRINTWPGGDVFWNSGAGNIFFAALGAVYQNKLMVAGDALRHFNELTIDLIVGNRLQNTGGIGPGGTFSIVFSNTLTPGFDATSDTLRMPLAPICLIQSNTGLWYLEITIREKEGAD